MLNADGDYDGIWQAREIVAKSISCPTVFLNLCPLERSLGNPRQRTLSEAFVIAGTRKVISSLWKVDDLPAAVTAKLYYRYLWERKTVADGNQSPFIEAEILRQAQMGVRDKVNSHPAYWAGYVLRY